MTNDYKVGLEQLLYGYYTKYDRLKELINSIEESLDSEYVDVYIDIYDMLKSAYKSNIIVDKTLLIVSSIINLAAHYRGYFWSRYGVGTRIFLVYGEDETNNHKQFYYQYEDSNQFKMTMNYQAANERVQSQLEMVKLLCAYIKGVYFVKRKTNSAMFIYDNMIKNNIGVPVFIVSKNKYMYQIPALFNGNCYIIRPKKSINGDESFIINKKNAIVEYFKSKNATLANIDSSLLSAILALTRFNEYNIPTKCNITIASKAINDAILSGKIINKYNSDVRYLYDAIFGFVGGFIKQDEFIARFNAIDLIVQYRQYSNMAEFIDMTWNIDLYDPHTIHRIAHKYFINNPLDLNNL